MNVLLIVPYNFEKTGGYYLPLTHYDKCLKENGYSVQYFRFPYHVYRSSEIRNLKKRLYDNIECGFDVLVAFGLNQCTILTRLIDPRKVEVRCVGIMMDCMRLHAESVLPYKVGIKLKTREFLKKIVYTNREKRCLKMYESTVFVSAVDTEYVKKFYKKRRGKVFYVPNGMDIPVQSKYVRKNEKSLCLGCLTGFSNDTLNENLYPMVRTIFPYISKYLPNIRLVIAGRGCPEKLVQEFQATKNIEFIGEVGEIDEFYSQVDIIVSTVRKRCGIINRILEGWAFSKTVIGYKNNFATFIEAKDGVDYLSADDKKEFLAVVRNCLTGKYDIDLIGKNGRKIVEDYYTWDKCGKRLLDVINGIED